VSIDDNLTSTCECEQMTRLKSGSERDEATQLEVSNGVYCVMHMHHI